MAFAMRVENGSASGRGQRTCLYGRHRYVPTPRRSSPCTSGALCCGNIREARHLIPRLLPHRPPGSRAISDAICASSNAASADVGREQQWQAARASESRFSCSAGRRQLDRGAVHSNCLKVPIGAVPGADALLLLGLNLYGRTFEFGDEFLEL
jgi:hypothetical protein